MKVIWSTQEEAPLYALDEDGLHQVLREKSKRLSRFIFWQEAQTYGSSLFVIGVVVVMLIAALGGFLKNLPSVLDVIALVIAAMAWIYFGGSVFLRRFRQRTRQRERDYGHCLRDELARDLSQLSFEIESRRKVLRAFLPPYTGAILLMWVYFRLMGAPAWAILPMIGIMVVACIWETGHQRRLGTDKLEPKRRELEALQEKLEQE